MAAGCPRGMWGRSRKYTPIGAATPKTPGKMKVRIAVRVAGEQPTWFTGTFDGSVCAR